MYQAGPHIFDFNGRSLREAGGIGETIVAAPIDVEALRKFRARPSGFTLGELRTDLFAPFYTRAKMLPLDTFRDGVIENRLDAPKKSAETIGRLQKRGTFIAPEGA